MKRAIKSDKVRILNIIIRELYYSSLLAWDKTDTQKVRFEEVETLQPGDLVVCKSDELHEHSIAWVHNVKSANHVILRELGGCTLWHAREHKFVKVVGLRTEQLYEGKRRDFYNNVLAAFKRSPWPRYEFGGLEFIDDQQALIWVKEYPGGIPDGFASVPFSVSVDWHLPGKALGTLAVLKKLEDAGCGQRAFERRLMPTITETTH
jgi:hypothetical protein